MRDRARWPTALRRFLDDGRIPLDNNDVERDLRQVALGRKNWMFIGSLAAGERTAAILSVVGSAHRHYLDLHAYLSDVLECLARRAQAPPPTNDDLDGSTQRVNTGLAGRRANTAAPSVPVRDSVRLKSSVRRGPTVVVHMVKLGVYVCPTKSAQAGLPAQTTVGMNPVGERVMLKG